MAEVSMARDLGLSLRAFSEDDSTNSSLSSFFARIHHQGRTFRDLKEAELEKEIEQLKTSEEGKETDQKSDEDAGDDGEEEEKLDITRAKEELLKQIRTAHNDAFSALDFVSLLLSKDTPRQAETSMSPYLKQTVPLGVLGAEKVRKVEQTKEQKEDLSTVARGWKAEAFSSAADMVLQSAQRLEKEIELESKYWEQVLAVDNGGWSICRLPSEKQTLGVRFGFRESGPGFRDRGMAALRRAEDGQIELDTGYLQRTPKSLHVEVLTKDGRSLASTQIPSAFGESASTEDYILQARNAIYDEELMYELTREARSLASFNVKIQDSSVIFPYEDRVISIRLVPLVNGSRQDDVDMQTEETETAVAESIALALRILLIYTHRKRLQKRSEIPPPLTAKAPPSQPLSLLRPLLTHIDHQSVLQQLGSYVDRVQSAIVSASVPCIKSIEIANIATVPHDDKILTESKAQAIIENIMSGLVDRLESSFKISIGKSKQIDVRIKTSLQPPTLGTELLVSSVTHNETQPSRGSSHTMRFDSVEKCKSYLDYLYVKCLGDILVSYRMNVTLPVLNKAEGSENTKELQWVQSQRPNELLMFYPNTGRSKRLILQISPGLVHVRWYWVGGENASGVGSYEWTGGPREETSSLLEIVQKASQYDE